MAFQNDRPPLVPIVLALGLAVVGLLVYQFANFREERAVRVFLEELKAGNYARAYQVWGPSAAYGYDDFMSDWGESGYYGRVERYRILESKTKGSGVIVYVQIDHLKKPVAFWVERKTRTLGFSPIYEYQSQTRAKS